MVPLLADLLSIPIGDRYPPLDLTPQKRKEKTLQAQLAQIEGLAARQPVLMVWEDVHWSDPTTRELLDLLVDRASMLRVLVIVTFRPEFAPPWLGRPHVTVLTLNRLPRRQGAEIITHVTGGRALPKEISDQIVDRTDGVPLFIEELTKTVVESGIVTEAGDHYALAGPMLPMSIPTSLQASLLARLDNLAPTREVAQIGAALGRSFSYGLISAVAEMPKQKLDTALAQLSNAELIFRRGVPPDAEYTFKHALVQDAAYSTLLRSRRQQIHSRIASVLETQFPEIVATQPTILAQHCTAGGLYEKAAEYWLKAGRLAFVRSAMVEALTSLRKGLDQLIKLPEGPTRQQYELDLLIALGPALIATKGYSASEVGETLARASGLADRLNRTDHLVALLYGHFAYHVVRAEYALALSFAEQLERIGIGHNDPASQLMAREGRGAVCVCRGEFQAARALFDSSGEPHLPRALYASVSVDDVYMVRQSRLGFTLACLGLLDQSRLQAREALLDARRLEHVYTLGHVLINVCHVEWLIGSPIGDQWHATEVISLAEEHGFPYWSSWGLLHRGRSVVARDSTEDAIAMMQEGLSIMRASGGSLLSTWVLTMLAEAYAKLGRPVEALKAIAEAFLVVDATDERIGEVELHRLRGDLLNVTGDPAAAERDYHLALAIAGKQSAKLFELRAATSLARLWLDQGKRKEACELFTPVYGWFTEGFDTRDLKEAKTLLDELAA